MLWNKFNLFTFNITCNIILSITKNTARIWKFGIVDDGSSPPLTASLFWFYYITALTLVLEYINQYN